MSRLFRAGTRMDLETEARGQVTGESLIAENDVDVEEFTQFARRAYKQAFEYRLGQNPNDLRRAAVVAALDCFLFGFKLGRFYEQEEPDGE